MKRLLVVLSVLVLTACGSPEDDSQQPSTTAEVPLTFDIAQIKDIIRQRCASCHSSTPTDDMFKVAPNNIIFDNLTQIKRSAPRIRARAVDSQTMPFLNKTKMTNEERILIGQWIKAGAPIE